MGFSKFMRFKNSQYLALLFVPLVYMIKDYIPESYAQENHLIENIQLVILGFGAILCYLAGKATRWKDKYIWMAGILFFLLMFGREISWGRTLFLLPDGNIPRWFQLGINKNVVHGIIGIAVAALLALLWKGNLYKFLKAMVLPVPNLICLAIFIVLVYISEHCQLPIFYSETDEELFECAAYLEMVHITRYVMRCKINAGAKKLQ